jgi:hypothetical protein
VTLHAAGASRANGLPFSENQLSSVVWRRRKHAQRRPGRHQNANAPGCEREASKSTISSASGFEPPPRDDRADGGAPEIGRISDRSKRFNGRPNSVSTPDASAAGGAGAFRATLNRAAALRRKVDNV